MDSINFLCDALANMQLEPVEGFELNCPDDPQQRIAAVGLATFAVGGLLFAGARRVLAGSGTTPPQSTHTTPAGGGEAAVVSAEPEPEPQTEGETVAATPPGTPEAESDGGSASGSEDEADSPAGGPSLAASTWLPVPGADEDGASDEDGVVFEGAAEFVPQAEAQPLDTYEDESVSGTQSDADSTPAEPTLRASVRFNVPEDPDSDPDELVDAVDEQLSAEAVHEAAAPPDDLRELVMLQSDLRRLQDELAAVQKRMEDCSDRESDFRQGASRASEHAEHMLQTGDDQWGNSAARDNFSDRGPEAYAEHAEESAGAQADLLRGLKVEAASLQRQIEVIEARLATPAAQEMVERQKQQASQVGLMAAAAAGQRKAPIDGR